MEPGVSKLQMFNMHRSYVGILVLFLFFTCMTFIHWEGTVFQFGAVIHFGLGIFICHSRSAYGGLSISRDKGLLIREKSFD